MPPLILSLAEQFRQQLIDRENVASVQMGRAWLDIERRLDASIHALAMEIAAMDRPTPNQIRRLRRYRILMEQAIDEVAKYADAVGTDIVERGVGTAALGWNHASLLTETAISAVPGIAVEFNRLPVPAVEHLAGFARPDAPLRGVLASAAGTGVDALAAELVAGAALGRNPNAIARQALRNGLGRAYTRLQTIARTETLRAYRAAALDNYRQSNVVTGYRRVASKSARTCIACLAVDGREYPLDVPFEEHPNGRCLAVPIVIGRSYDGMLTGQQWFDQQPETTQREIMGAERYALWRAGRVEWGQLASLHENETWGNHWRPTPVEQLR